MLTIQIKNWENKVVAVINDVFSLQVDDEVNKGGKLKFRFPTEKRLQERPVTKGNRISVLYWLKIWQIVKLFDGYITDVLVKTDSIEIQSENWLSYLQNRIIRSTKNYSWATIQSVVSAIFTELNTTFALPISLWLNDCQTTITRQFDVWTSFYDILKYCRESEKKLIVRVKDGVLEVSKNTWKVLDGVWEYDVRNTRETNIADWSWKDSMDKFYSYIQNENGNQSNSVFNNEYKLIFEKYEWEATLTVPSWKAIPSVNVSRDTDWWDFYIWDRKNIRLNTWYERLPLEYLGLIQSRRITINANWWIKSEIKISEEYTEETNILDLILQNLKQWSSWGGWGWDMSNYYTKSQTTAIIDWKMDEPCTEEDYEQEYWWIWDDRTFIIYE